MIEVYLRLAGATLLLLLPGALVARSVSGALTASLALIGAALVVVFATASSLELALWLLAAATLALGVRVSRGARGSEPRAPDRVTLAVAGAGIAFGLLLWRLLPPPVGDALFHLARVQKLVAFDSLSLENIGEFADGGLHPGYAFPLWHGFLGLVAELSGVDPAVVVRREAAVLAPLSFLVVYEAGRAIFDSRRMGVATLAATLGLVAFASNSGGAFRSLALPATAGGRQLLVAAALALVFGYLRARSWTALASVAAGAFVVAAVHPTYALYTLLLLAGFALARLALLRTDAKALGLAVGTFAVAAGLFFLWLLPVVRATASFNPSTDGVADRRHGIERYPRQFVVESPTSYHLSPALITRAGPVPVAGLALVPLALLAARRRWAAFVLGSTVLVLTLVLFDPLFTRFADVVSLSQSRRLAGFLPFAFALAGGAAVLARVLGWALPPLALAAGVLVELLWPGDFGYVMREGGPTLPVWIALGGGVAGLAAAALLRERLPSREAPGWLAAGACALFVAPLLVTTDWARPRPALELTGGLVEAVQRETQPGDVLLSDPVTSYWLAGQAPVYVAVSEPSHVGDTAENRPYERVERWDAYVRTGRFDGRYDWIVLDRRRAGDRECSPARYRDGRYTVCPAS